MLSVESGGTEHSIVGRLQVWRNNSGWIEKLVNGFHQIDGTAMGTTDSKVVVENINITTIEMMEN